MFTSVIVLKETGLILQFSNMSKDVDEMKNSTDPD